MVRSSPSTGATLSGAIPESAINDSYTTKSRFLGGVSMSTEGGFSIRVGTKSDSATVKAFWLAKGSRLVIDAHGEGKATAKNDDAAPTEDRTVASKDNKDVGVAANTATATKRKAYPAAGQRLKMAPRGPAESFYCFPLNSQVGLSVVFQSKKRVKPEDGTTTRIDLESSQDTANDSDSIACYPSSAQVIATIIYHDGAAATDTTPPAVTAPATTPAPRASTTNQTTTGNDGFSWAPVNPATTSAPVVARPAAPQAMPVVAETPAAQKDAAAAEDSRTTASKAKSLSPNNLLPPLK